MPIDTVQIGDDVVVHDHVAIPVDGDVVDGEAVVDQSAITGETLPVSIVAGSAVHAGSVVLRGRLVIRARAVGNQTTIGRIISRVEEAQLDRAPIQTVGENFSRRFVPISFIVSAVTLALTGDVRRAMTMLLIACPCAVGLSTPTAISAAIGNGARRGILIKGGSHLEQAGRVDAIVFDKTGTLTVGRPVVTNIIALHDDWQPEQVLAYAASSELHSRHPLAEAVIRSTEERRIIIPPHEECEVLVGLGMRTWADGRTLLLGSPSLLRSENVAVSQEASDWVDKLRRQAETPLLLAVDDTLVGLISLRDEVRTEAPEVLKQLRANGIRRIVMLTGDHPDIAKVVAAELGIDEWRAEVMPEDKLEVVRQLQDEGYIVGMVGDGINDAPALAAANIGIAMGLAGTDVAVETADVALANDDLRRLLDVGDLGTRAVEVDPAELRHVDRRQRRRVADRRRRRPVPRARGDPAQRLVGGRRREQFTVDSVPLGLNDAPVRAIGARTMSRMSSTPLDPVASERLSHADKVFTSDLSINEFALLHGAGFEPLDLVMGVSVYHVGYQFTGIRQQSELPVLTEATYRARWNAMARMQAEADALGADGVVGVRLEWRQHGAEAEHLEFIAVGTAVRYSPKPGSFKRTNGQAFSSHLSGQDLATLLRSG